MLMILATDVCYRNGEAIASGVTFDRWESGHSINSFITRIHNVAAYEPGQFYKRELPCLLKLLKQLENLPEYIIVDGYVFLDDEKRPGLGKYLYDDLQGKSIVIGVAKNRFKDMSSRNELCRGTSKKPLYITAVGIDELEAKALILKMHGEYRMPTLLKLVDYLGKQSENISS